jgi:hypothetical protein
VQRAVIQQRSGQCIFIAFAEHAQVLFGAVIIALEAKQLEQRGSAARIGGVVTQMCGEPVDGFVQFSGANQIIGLHTISCLSGTAC